MAAIHSNCVIIFVNPCKMCFNNESIKFALQFDAIFIFAYPSSSHTYIHTLKEVRGCENERAVMCASFVRFVPFFILLLSSPFLLYRTHYVYKEIIVAVSREKMEFVGNLEFFDSHIVTKNALCLPKQPEKHTQKVRVVEVIAISVVLLYTIVLFRFFSLPFAFHFGQIHFTEQFKMKHKCGYYYLLMAQFSHICFSIHVLLMSPVHLASSMCVQQFTNDW